MNTLQRGAMAILGLTLGLSGCGTSNPDGPAVGSDRTSPSPTPAEVTTRIPTSFPLGLGMARDDEVDTLPYDDEPGITNLSFCGADPLKESDPVDVLSVDNSGGESANTRDLRLYGSEDEARTVAQALRDRAQACPEQASEGIAMVRNEVLASPLAPDPSSAVVQTFATDGEVGDDLIVSHVVTAGNALLVTQTYAMVSPDQAGTVVEETASELRRTVDALALFAGGTTPSPDPESDRPQASERPSIPAGFPLATGFPRYDSDIRVTDPAPDAEGTGGVTVCGQDVWPVSGAGTAARLVASARGPESTEDRELFVFTDDSIAQEALAGLQAVRTCEEFENQRWQDLTADTGHESTTLGLTYADGLGSTVLQWTRVGSAVLLVTTYREGDLDSIGDQATEVSKTSRKLARHMCTFSVAGC